MAKFCGKCGSKLDQTTGLCPNCDADKIERHKQRKKKILRLKIILGSLILVIATGGSIYLLARFGIINVPVISEIFNEEDTSDGNVSVSVLGKNFTDKRITDETSAVAAAKDVAETMGYQNAFSELKVKVSTSVDNKCFYRLQQYYKGLPVYGRYVTVVSSEDGNALGINSDALDVDADIEMKPQISDEQMQTAIKEYMKGKAGILYEDIVIPEISDDFLVIYNQSGESRLAYAVKVINDDTYNIVVDACTGEILEGSSGVDSIAATGTNVAGTKQFPVEYDESANTYTLQDQARGIYVYNFNKSSHKNKKTWGKKTEVVSVNDNIFGNTEEEANQSPEIGINLLNNIEEIEDYYQTTFNQGSPYEMLILAYNDGYMGGKNAIGGCWDATTENGEMYEYGVVYIGHKMKGTERDILAHEYTHIIERKYGAACGEAVETNAVNEGVADTFACFYTGKWGINLENIGGTYRSASDPGKYNYPASLDDKNKSGEKDDHGYATVVSHAAYLMNQSKTFSEKELQLLWYETLLQLPYNCTFYDLRACMEQTAIISDYSETQKQAIATAFDEVEVFEKGEYKCNNSININVYDKQGEYYDDYNIRIDGTTSEGFAGMGGKKYSLSVDNQSAEKYHLDLQNGKYTITITDKADETVVKTFKIKVKQSNHREELYAFDFGADYSVAPQAKLTFLDAEGNELSDYSVSASYKGGKYSVDSNNVDLDEGNYYIGLFSKDLDESGAVYYETFSLRIKNGLKSSETIQTGFEIEKVEKEETERIETEKTSKKMMIPSDAAEFNGHHYYVYDMDNITTWEQAEAYCESLGGYLATITSREEDEFVYFYLRNNFDYESAYFGFTDREEEGTWGWVNGENSTYTNWNPGEPNDENPNEDYAMYYYKYPEGTWNDGDFGYETLNSGQVFICEWGKPTTINIYDQYAEKIREYEERYGEAEVRDDGSSGQYMTGLCFAKLMDFAGDGQKELLVAYSDGSQEGIPQNYTAEVWGVTEGQLRMMYSGEISFSDGGFEYIELWTGSEKSYLCAGGFGNEWYGFDENGQFSLVREATMRMSQSGGWIYEINGKEVSSEEYYQNEADWSTGYENTEYWLSNEGLDSDKIFSEIEETKKELNME